MEFVTVMVTISAREQEVFSSSVSWQISISVNENRNCIGERSPDRETQASIPAKGGS
jgi:hypothetical protein